MTRSRTFTKVVSVLLCAGLLAGCGEEAEEAPSAEATTIEDYCQAYEDYFQQRASLGSQAPDAEVIATMKAWADDLERIGPPEEMPATARAGRTIWLDLVGQIDDDATADDVVALEQGLPRGQADELQAFFLYNDEGCPQAG